MEYPTEKLLPLSVWYHPMSHGFYTVIGVSTCSTNGPNDNKEEVVVYFSHKHRKLWHRAIEEFLDGRFVPQMGVE